MSFKDPCDRGIPYWCGECGASPTEPHRSDCSQVGDETRDMITDGSYQVNDRINIGAIVTKVFPVSDRMHVRLDGMAPVVTVPKSIPAELIERTDPSAAERAWQASRAFDDLGPGVWAEISPKRRARWAAIARAVAEDLA